MRAAFGAFGSVLLVTLFGCGDASEYPQEVELTARPGTAVVVPFRQPVEGAPKRALSYVPAAPILDPKPLPQEMALLHSSLALFSSGVVSGDVLLHVPETAAGQIEFTLAASGGGRGQAASIVGFRTGAVSVTIRVDGTAVDEATPTFTGVWRQDDTTWTFLDGLSPILEMDHAAGEQERMLYETYPDGQGRWFLVDPGPEGAAYWIDTKDPDTLLVSHIDEAFAPFAKLTRQ